MHGAKKVRGDYFINLIRWSLVDYQKLSNSMHLSIWVLLKFVLFFSYLGYLFWFLLHHAFYFTVHFPCCTYLHTHHRHDQGSLCVQSLGYPIGSSSPIIIINLWTPNCRIRIWANSLWRFKEIVLVRLC